MERRLLLSDEPVAFLSLLLCEVKADSALVNLIRTIERAPPMGCTLIASSEGFNIYVHDELPEEEVLGIPYFKHDPNSYSYVNLRDEPEKIAEIPELQDCETFKYFVLALNAPRSPFQTFGCDKGKHHWLNDQYPGCTMRYGSYLDIAFVDTQTSNRDTYLDLIRRFRQYAFENHVSGFYNMMQVFFGVRPTVSPNGNWWTLSLNNLGVGRTEDEGYHWWEQCIRHTQEFFSQYEVRT